MAMDSQLELRQVDEATVSRFLRRDRALSIAANLHPPSLLAMLRRIGVTLATPSEPRNCQQRFLDHYRRYLLQERGLAVDHVGELSSSLLSSSVSSVSAMET